MKLITPPWKTAWYDDQISDRFFHEMSRTETAEVRELESSARWMSQMIIEVGQLAQNMSQLEKDAPHPSQVRLAFEKALKLSTLAAHLAAALDRANPDRRHTPMAARQAQSSALIPRPKLEPAPARATSKKAVAPAVQVAPVGPGAPAAGFAPAAALTPAGTENSMDETQPPVAPLRQTVTGLSRRGLSVAEIEVITGQSRTQIETVLNER